MKRVVGSPGTWSGMALRLSQCVCAAASTFSMVSGFGYSNYSAFFYLIVALILQIMWSSRLAYKDIFALRNKKDLHTRDNLLFIVIVDWVMAIFMFSAACASASLTIFLMWDVNFCGTYSRLACQQFALSVVLAFITWLLQAASSFSVFWLLVSFY
ncbi:CASP-like protein 5B3 [Triticum dicoccoides]|uniref:CASP-like protein 5B3 n=1 Tax=Triticum dicoccoides TaxID=85692 RepID=UPI00188F18F6|nr:CASP-like protein 5B3 [Triticum dicoccoides]XP_044345474.1 CASP-like protein 5B3 [Triticum aestivum]